MEVRRISAKDTYQLRNRILRPNELSADDYTFPGDDDDQTFHLGAFEDGKLVSIASFFFQGHPDIDTPYQYRLRGMATIANYRKKGLSKALVRTGIPIVKQNQCQVLWCNARQEAIGFYESMGFKKLGTAFDLEYIGTHQVMFFDIP